MNLPPGNFGLPIVGETQHWAKNPAAFVAERAARYGPVWKTHLMGHPCAVLLEPDGNRAILDGTHDLSSRAGWNTSIVNLMPRGLTFLDDDDHLHHRRVLLSVLRARAVAAYWPAMQHIVDTQLRRWPRHTPIQMVPRMRTLTFALIAHVLLGLEPDAPMTQQFAHHMHRFTSGLFAFPAWRVPGLRYDRAWHARGAMVEIIRACIQQQRRAPAACVLSQLLGMDALPDDDLIDEMLVLLWAGHDTSMAFLTWAVYELAQHPDAVQRLRHEQAQIGGAVALHVGQLDHLPLLRAFLREVERLHPPAPGGFRYVRDSFHISNYIIPAGWTLFYATAYTHQMPELWHHPTAFAFDRHLPPHHEGRAPYQLIGFGAGPRVCIGRALAQIELCLVVATLVQRFDVRLMPQQDLRVQTVPVQVPQSGLWVTIAHNHA